eukprot:gene23467-28411_t
MCLDKCFMRQSPTQKEHPLQQNILQLLSCILHYCKLCRVAAPRAPTSDQLTTIHNTFTRSMRFVLQMIKRNGELFKALLVRLDYNGFYMIDSSMDM